MTDQRLKSLLCRALALPSGQRGAFIDRVSGRDSVLRGDLAELAAAHERAGALFGAPTVHTRTSGEGPARASHRDDQPVAPGYAIGPKLGEGGMGTVYRAWQLEPVHREVAIKVLKPAAGGDEILRRFAAERQVLALMMHGGIARVYDAGVTENGRPYFAMELVEGEPITEFCERHRLDLRARLELFRQVCHAVQHAHQRGVIHRDLKPNNILITEVDDTPQPKVIDFGVAHAIDGPLADLTIFAQTDGLVGTPMYMAPEQASFSDEAIDIRTDVYSLGMILYELLVGAPAFDAASMKRLRAPQLERFIRDAEPARLTLRLAQLGAAGSDIADRRQTDPTRLARALRGDLDWIVGRAMEKCPDRRYPTALSLAGDVDRFLNHEPVSAGPPSTTYRIGKFARRHRAGVSAASLAAIALVGGLIAASYGLAQARTERDGAREARDESELVTTFLTNMIASVSPTNQGQEVTVTELLDVASHELTSALDTRPVLRARLHHTLGSAYRGLGRIDDADGHLGAALRIRQRELGPEDPATLRVLCNVVGLRIEQGRYHEAAALSEKAVDGWEHTHGPSDPLTLGALNNHAQLLRHIGDLDEAVRLQQRVLDGLRETLGPHHRHTLGSMTNLASMRQAQGQTRDAERLHRKAVAGWRSNHGPDHTGTILATHNLALFHDATGRPTDAARGLRTVVAARHRILGTDHPDTIAATLNLAEVERRLGDNASAEQSYLETTKRADATLGPAHPHTIAARIGLLTLYEAAAWPPRSRSVVTESIARLREVATESQALSSADQNAIAWLLLTVEPSELRDPPTALTLAQRACARARANGRSLWMFLDTLALAQSETGDNETAAKSQREALDHLPDAKTSHRPDMEARYASYAQDT